MSLAPKHIMVEKSMENEEQAQNDELKLIEYTHDRKPNSKCKLDGNRLKFLHRPMHQLISDCRFTSKYHKPNNNIFCVLWDYQIIIFLSRAIPS